MCLLFYYFMHPTKKSQRFSFFSNTTFSTGYQLSDYCLSIIQKSITFPHCISLNGKHSEQFQTLLIIIKFEQEAVTGKLFLCPKMYMLMQLCHFTMILFPTLSK